MNERVEEVRASWCSWFVVYVADVGADHAVGLVVPVQVYSVFAAGIHVLKSSECLVWLAEEVGLDVVLGEAIYAW